MTDVSDAKEQAEHLFYNLKQLVNTKSDFRRMLELLKPHVLGDDVMMALMWETQIKSYCQTLSESEDDATSRVITDLLVH